MKALYITQQKTGVLAQDPHGGNWGWKDKNPAMFDFGRSKIDWDNPNTSGKRRASLS
jgi:hypothetical protein